MATTIENYGSPFTQYDEGDRVRVKYDGLDWEATVKVRNTAITGSGFHPYYTVTGSSRPVPHSYLAPIGQEPTFCNVCGC